MRNETNQDLTSWDMGFIALCMLGAAVCAFLAGEDAAMDEISYGDRLRVVCSTPGHSETLCHNTAQGRNERE